MMKQEFENMALRGNAEIGGMMYESIERFYMSDNRYHEQFGGRDETKQDFVKRVFGGKVNTPKSIARKIADEANRENRWCLRGNSHADKKELDRHETLIREHYDALLRYNL
jgi:hypothetical protein